MFSLLSIPTADFECVMHGLLQTNIGLVALRSESPEAVRPSPLDPLDLRRAQANGGGYGR